MKGNQLNHFEVSPWLHTLTAVVADLMLRWLLKSEKNFPRCKIKVWLKSDQAMSESFDRDKEKCQGESLIMVIQFPFQATNVAEQFNIPSNISSF